MANSKNLLLDSFKDNQSQDITAADMRAFVTAMYDEMVEISSIKDNLSSTDTKSPLSANQGKILYDMITAVTARLDDLDKRLSMLETAHTNAATGDFSNFPATISVQDGIILDIK